MTLTSVRLYIKITLEITFSLVTMGINQGFPSIRLLLFPTKFISDVNCKALAISSFDSLEKP